MSNYLYKSIFYFLINVLLPLSVTSQNQALITVKKEPGIIFFFQKGAKSDTLIKDKNNVFYLLVPDSLKEKILFSVDNGQIFKTDNDSLVKLNYLPGLKYEYKYTIKNETASLFTSKNKPVKKTGQYETLINGTSNCEEGKITIQIKNTASGKVIYNLNFFYR